MKRVSPADSVIYIETEQSDSVIKMSYANKLSLYGITKEQFLEIAKQQGNCCASCGVDATDIEYRLCVDHDHTTNEIRGLLCDGCNTALGWLGDDATVARKLADYIESAGTGLFVPERNWKR